MYFLKLVIGSNILKKEITDIFVICRYLHYLVVE